MEFNNRIIVENTTVSATSSGGYYGAGSGGESLWYVNGDSELTPFDSELTVNANSVLCIGDFLITATPDGLAITKKDGTMAHLSCTGEITAYKTQ